MKQKTHIIGIFIVCFVILLILLFVFLPKSPHEGELKVESEPVATIFLDNTELGRTPYSGKVKAGEYTMKLVADAGNVNTHYASWQGKVKVGTNLLTYVNAIFGESDLTTAVDYVWLEKINQKKSEFSVAAVPTGSSVLINNETKGQTPITLQNIESGNYQITITSPGYLTRSIKVKAIGGYRLVVTSKLALSGIGVNNTDLTMTQQPVSSQSALLLSPTPKLALTVSPTGTMALPKKPYVLIKDTPTGFLRIRSEPTTSSSESGRLKPGDTVSIKSEKDGWFQLMNNGVVIGWVSGQYVDKVE